jgi:ABC-type multidrug transport system permease subunit
MNEKLKEKKKIFTLGFPLENREIIRKVQILTIICILSACVNGFFGLFITWKTSIITSIILSAIAAISLIVIFTLWKTKNY